MLKRARSRSTSPALRRATLALLCLAAAWAAPVLAAPRIDGAEIAALAFAEPRRSESGGHAVLHLDGVKITLRGEGFLPKDAGPIIWVNGMRTQMVRVAADRRSLDALFYASLASLEAAGSGTWVVEYQDSPTATRAAVPGTPTVTRLGTGERAALEARKQALGID